MNRSARHVDVVSVEHPLCVVLIEGHSVVSPILGDHILELPPSQDYRGTTASHSQESQRPCQLLHSFEGHHLGVRNFITVVGYLFYHIKGKPYFCTQRHPTRTEFNLTPNEVKHNHQISCKSHRKHIIKRGNCRPLSYLKDIRVSSYRNQ